MWRDKSSPRRGWLGTTQLLSEHLQNLTHNRPQTGDTAGWQGDNWHGRGWPGHGYGDTWDWQGDTGGWQGDTGGWQGDKWCGRGWSGHGYGDARARIQGRWRQQGHSLSSRRPVLKTFETFENVLSILEAQQMEQEQLRLLQHQQSLEMLKFYEQHTVLMQKCRQIQPQYEQPPREKTPRSDSSSCSARKSNKRKMSPRSLRFIDDTGETEQPSSRSGATSPPPLSVATARPRLSTPSPATPLGPPSGAGRTVRIYTAGMKHVGLWNHLFHDRDDCDGMANKFGRALHMDFDVAINCAPLHDPTRYRCTGESRAIMSGILANDERGEKMRRVSGQVWQMVHLLSINLLSGRPKDSALLLYCMSGTHRSLVMARVVHVLLPRLFPQVKVHEPCHLHRGHWHRDLCHLGCEACTSSASKDAVVDEFIDIIMSHAPCN